MQRTPTTPNTGVDERPIRVGLNRPSSPIEQGISGKDAAVSSKSGPTAAIGLEQTRELKTIFNERKGGYDPEKLFMALSMLITEKDFVDHFRRQKSVRIAGTTNQDSDRAAMPKII